MERSHLSKFDLPDAPGVYLFKKGRKVLYVGKATSLRDRVRSYFDDALIVTRGSRIVDMVTNADRVAHEPTPTVLEALVREAALIKKYLPKANVEGKDDKTFLYAVITKEEWPRVLTVRGKDIDFDARKAGDQRFDLRPGFSRSNLNPRPPALRAIYGPFPSGPQLREALRLIRRIFPFFDTPKPVETKSKHHKARIEFNKQIRQYPQTLDKKEYRRTIRRVMLLLSGHGKELRAALDKDMKQAAREDRFEDAARLRQQLFALNHVQEVALIKDESMEKVRTSVAGARIEAYDTAHLSGTNAIGVMTVLVDGALSKRDYRTFRIRGFKKNDDIASLKEILSRRLTHSEWPFPSVIVVVGGKTQKKAAESVLARMNLVIPVVAVVKDERHRPREVIGLTDQVARRAGISEADAILANSEAHRFSLARHRVARSRTSLRK